MKLNEIARSLGKRTALKKVIERLGRQLGRPGLRERVQENLLSEAAPFVGQDPLLVIDPTDLIKPFARKIEHVAEVRDASEKEFGPGYWCLMVVAVHRVERQIVPLYQELYSQRAPDFESENVEILRAVETVAAATGERGLWLMDRGGDRRRPPVPDPPAWGPPSRLRRRAPYGGRARRLLPPAPDFATEPRATTSEA